MEATDPEALVPYLKALGSPRRLEILRLLEEPHYLEEIASHLGVARQTAREHLDRLVDAGFVEKVPGERETGSVTDYVAVPERLFAVLEDLRRVSGAIPATDRREGLRRRTEALDRDPDAPDEPDLPRLVLVHGMRIGQTVRLEGEGPWMIGRDPGAALSLDFDPFVSGKHAEIRRVAAGFEIQDLYSSNGTYLEWEELPRGSASEIADGEVVQVGRTILLFRTSGRG